MVDDCIRLRASPTAGRTDHQIEGFSVGALAEACCVVDGAVPEVAAPLMATNGSIGKQLGTRRETQSALVINLIKNGSDSAKVGMLIDWRTLPTPVQNTAGEMSTSPGSTWPAAVGLRVTPAPSVQAPTGTF